MASRKVFKYELLPCLPGEAADIEMPNGASVIKFDYQNGIPRLWAIVNKDEPSETRQFVIFSTGQELVLPDDDSSELEYTGTAFNGAFVWHCFEVIEIG